LSQANAKDDWADLPGRLIVISGPSGVGKSTVAHRLVEYPGMRARLSISATTREPRLGEQDEVDYYFLTRAEFEAARHRGEFLECAEVHGHLYGTPAARVRTLLAEGTDVILVIDVQGGRQVRQRVPNALLIFLHPPSMAELERRLRARGTDDEATIRRRLENARHEIELAKQKYTHDVINDNLDDAVKALVLILKQAGG
jgi:guanylate kinase